MMGLFFGAGLGLGVWILYRALSPRPEPIGAILARLERPGRPLTGTVPTARPSVVTQAERSAVALLQRAGIGSPPAPSLELTGSSQRRHALEKVGGAVAGVLAVGFLAILATTVGLPPSPAIVLVLAAVAGALGFVLPDLVLRDQAARRKRAFRHALSAYLDLVNVLLAGGAGIETALFAAAGTGDGWAFERLRTALDRARRTGRSPWDTLTDLGRTLDVSELGELAASVSLAGSHGARIRASLAAKADSLRGHQVAETEAAAEAATERMTIPLAVLLFGFLIMIAFPAMQQITTVAGA